MSAIPASVEFALRACHRVRILHGGTGKPLPGIKAELVDPAWPHWRLHRRGALIQLSAYEPFAGDRPATTKLRVRITSHVVAARFPGNGVAELDLAQADTDVTHTMAPLDHAVQITLLDADGDPVPGRTVRIRAAKSSAVVPTDEVAPGVYRTAARQWAAGFRPARVTVDGTPQDRRVTPDWRRDVTELQLTIAT